MCSKSRETASATRSTADSEETSQLYAFALTPSSPISLAAFSAVSCSTSTTAMSAPRCATWKAISLPIPRPAPVTRAAFPFKSMSCNTLDAPAPRRSPFVFRELTVYIKTRRAFKQNLPCAKTRESARTRAPTGASTRLSVRGHTRPEFLTPVCVTPTVPHPPSEFLNRTEPHVRPPPKPVNRTRSPGFTRPPRTDSS